MLKGLVKFMRLIKLVATWLNDKCLHRRIQSECLYLPSRWDMLDNLMRIKQPGITRTIDNCSQILHVS